MHGFLFLDAHEADMKSLACKGARWEILRLRRSKSPQAVASIHSERREKRLPLQLLAALRASH